MAFIEISKFIFHGSFSPRKAMVSPLEFLTIGIKVANHTFFCPQDIFVQKLPNKLSLSLSVLIVYFQQTFENSDLLGIYIIFVLRANFLVRL